MFIPSTLALIFFTHTASTADAFSPPQDLATSPPLEVVVQAAPQIITIEGRIGENITLALPPMRAQQDVPECYPIPLVFSSIDTNIQLPRSTWLTYSNRGKARTIDGLSSVVPGEYKVTLSNGRTDKTIIQWRILILPKSIPIEMNIHLGKSLSACKLFTAQIHITPLDTLKPLHDYDVILTAQHQHKPILEQWEQRLQVDQNQILSLPITLNEPGTYLVTITLPFFQSTTQIYLEVLPAKIKEITLTHPSLAQDYQMSAYPIALTLKNDCGSNQVSEPVAVTFTSSDPRAHVPLDIILPAGIIENWIHPERFRPRTTGEQSLTVIIPESDLSSTLMIQPNQKKIRDIALGDQFSCTLNETGLARCWGWNLQGQLGLGDILNRGDKPDILTEPYPSVELGVKHKINQISVGGEAVCALLNHQNIKCWGGNQSGQLGLEDTISRGSQPLHMGDNLPVVRLGTDIEPLQITAGYSHFCALVRPTRQNQQAKLQIKCWGENRDAQLGIGDKISRGHQSLTMEDRLPGLDVSAERSPLAVYSGLGWHTCTLLDDQSVRCWGGNWIGQLGLGDTIPRGQDNGQMGNNLPAIQVGTQRSIERIFPLPYHTCAILDNGRVKCWGDNDWGTLGLGDTLPRGDIQFTMGDQLPYVELSNKLRTRHVVGGEHTTCLLFENGMIGCYGENRLGQLGVGDILMRGATPQTVGQQTSFVQLATQRRGIAISAGYNHFCVLQDNDQLVCFGDNRRGGLGIGDTISRGTSMTHMGEQLLPIALWW